MFKHFCIFVEINTATMFGLFKRKTEKELLQKQYEKLMKEAYDLSSVNRKSSDDKVFEAEQIMKKIETINKS